MPSEIKKKLYLANDLSSLNKLANKADLSKAANPRILLKSAEKLLENARNENLSGDEEKAYVLYMRYFNTISVIKKTAEYKKNESFYKDLIGTKNCGEAISAAEALSTSLKNRYEEKEAQEVIKKMEALEVSAANSHEPTLTKSEVVDEKVGLKYESPGGGKGGLDSAKDKRLSGEILAKDVPDKKESQKEEAKPFIDARTLYERLIQRTAPANDILLMDVRFSKEFAESHVKHSHCINIPGDLLPPGSTSNQIYMIMPDESKSLWNRRNEFDSIVLLDWFGVANVLQTKEPIRVLKDAIFKWDQKVTLKREPVVLEGGYDDWLTVYPTMTTNSAAIRPPALLGKKTASASSLENIQYDLDLEFLLSPEEKRLKALAATSSPGINGSVPAIVGTASAGTTSAPPSVNVFSSPMPKFDRTTKPKPVFALSGSTAKVADSSPAANVNRPNNKPDNKIHQEIESKQKPDKKT